MGPEFDKISAQFHKNYIEIILRISEQEIPTFSFTEYLRLTFASILTCQKIRPLHY